MTCIDVFNGDADGLCALHQLRLADPREDRVLVTGVKRDIALVERIERELGREACADDELTVLDVSLDKNRDALVALLDKGVRTRYFDHHFPGEIPERPNLSTHIDTDAETCTGLIVDRHLDGAHRAWAVTAAFGDNLFRTATDAAAPLALDAARLDTLKTLGTLLNYNGYGASLEDLFFPPAELCERLRPYADPFDFVADDDAFATLEAGYRDDMARAEATRPERHDERTALYVFPNEPFARRVGGVYANELAQRHPERAHALLSESADGSYVVSVRAPLANRTGADELCRRFETGGGRKAAAGINRLPPGDVERFADALAAQYA